MTNLSQGQCTNDPKLAPRLDAEACEKLIAELSSGWDLNLADQILRRRFEFKNYHQTLAFTNAVAWIAHQQDHHPDMTISYRHCLVCFTTHSVGGLSINDFICAARIDALQS